VSTSSRETINTEAESKDKQEALAAMTRCIPILENIADQSELLALLSENQRIALITAAGKISRPNKKEIKKRNKDRKKQKRLAIVEKERRLRADTGIRRAREDDVFTAPQQICGPDVDMGIEDKTRTLETPRNCYVCKTEFVKLHHFYDTMCPECAEFNYQKRFQTASFILPVLSFSAIISGRLTSAWIFSSIMLPRLFGGRQDSMPI